jgi:hypothetical protein
MPKHNHRFVEEYEGLVGFGYNREVDEATVKYYLQKFSEDEHASLILGRMSDSDLESVFNMLGELMKKYMKENEYHKYFLKDNDEAE